MQHPIFSRHFTDAHPLPLQDGVVLIIPVMTNDMEKELIIYEHDDSTEAVTVFCSENMPDDADECIDHLLNVVRGKLAEVSK